MKLSIITINYNNATGLQKTLKSLLTQTLSPCREEDLEVEHIIIDGASTDNSMDIIRQYADCLGERRKAKGDEARRRLGDEARGREGEATDAADQSAITVRWISEHDSGIYNAMNKGIEIACGLREVDSFNRSKRSEDKHASQSTVKENKVINQVEPHYIQILNSGDILASDDVISRMASAFQQSASTSSSTLDSTSASSCSSNTHSSDLSPFAIRHSPNGYPAILYGNMIKAYPNGKRHRDTCGSDLYTPQSFLYFYLGTLNHDCAWIQADLFRQYGLYNEQMKICSDWEWYVRTIVLGDWAMRQEGEKAEGERRKPLVPVYTNIDVTIFDMTGVSEDGGKNRDLIRRERREYLESILPPAILRDYDMYAFPITQYQRLRKYHLWGIVYFVERVLFKLEKWGILK